MTSWTRGKENEEKGERDMSSPHAGEKIKGAGEKAAGETEQGINNVGDRLSGKQSDLEGHERTGKGEDGNWSDTDMDDTSQSV